MLNWFRSQVKELGLAPATQLLLRVVRYRIPVVLSNRLWSDKLECPCCNWRGHRFLDYIELGYHVPNAACPRCDSHSRHRALYLWLKNEFQIEKKSGRALIFAPELEDKRRCILAKRNACFPWNSPLGKIIARLSLPD